MNACDQGGTYWYPNLDGDAKYEPVCGHVAVVRYRSPGMVEGHWGYRCARHGRGYLDSTGKVTIEDLTLDTTSTAGAS